MTLEEFSRHKIIPLREYKGKLKYPNIILSYTVTGCITADFNSKYRKTQHSARKAVEELIINDPNEKPRIILDKFDQQINIIDRDTDSIVPKNNKEITNIRAAITRKNVTGITDEITSELAYLLGQPGGKTITDPSKEELLFLQEMLFRKAKQPSYIPYLNQSLTDIERFCTNKSDPSSYRSVLAIDTTFNIGQHYVTQMTYQNLSLLRKDILTSPWFPGPVLIHRHQEKSDFSHLWQAVKRGNRLLKDLAIIGTDECRELFDGIPDEIQGNTDHLLGKEHVLKNIQKKLEQLSFPSRQIKWIVNDIFGSPFVQEKEGLIQSESQEEFNNRYKKFKKVDRNRKELYNKKW